MFKQNGDYIFGHSCPCGRHLWPLVSLLHRYVPLTNLLVDLCRIFSVPKVLLVLYVRGRGVGDGSENGGFPWRAECLPPTAREQVVAEAAASVANGASPTPIPSKAIVPLLDAPLTDSILSNSFISESKPPPPMRLTRRWSLASWSEFLQNAPILR